MISANMMKDAYQTLESQVKATSMTVNHLQDDRNKNAFDDNEKTRINLRISKALKNEWDLIAKTNGLTLTRVLICSMAFLRDSLEKGNVKISEAGLIYK